MKIKFVALSLLLGIFFTLTGYAGVDEGSVSPSFDCNKARSISEKLICSDAELSRLDNELVTIYYKAKLAAHDKKAFATENTLRWKQREGSCTDKECLFAWFASRKAELMEQQADTEFDNNDNLNPAILSDSIVQSDRPDPKSALQELFSVTDSSGAIKIAQDKLASIWFDQTFQDGSGQVYVVFVKEQKIDENGQLGSCHSCGASIDAVTYKNISGNWVAISKQKNITELGNWGDIPKINGGEIETKHGEILRLSPDNTVLLIKGEGQGQGVVAGYKEILAFHQNKWQYLGTLDVWGNNEGADCINSRKQFKASDDSLWNSSCWSYTGKVSIGTSNGTPYPNIVVKHKGTEYSDLHKVVLARNIVYIFNGKEYIPHKTSLSGCTSNCTDASAKAVPNVAAINANSEADEHGFSLWIILFVIIIGLYLFVRRRSTLPIQNHKPLPVLKPQMSVSAESADFRIPVAPEGYGAAKWIPKGQAIKIAGISISDGMIYVGTILKSGHITNDPCLIDPSKLVAESGDFTVRHFSYWPSYSDISAEARRAYLEWLSGGRSHPDVDIGFVFLFFYGLERRVIIDASNDSTILAEYPVIAKEIRRLLSIYGGKSGSFKGYASGLLDWVSLGPLKNNKLYLEPVPELSKSFELPLYIRLALGMAAVDSFPVPKHLACAWSKLDPSIVTRTPAKRCPEYYDKLFELKYIEIFGSGMILSPNKTKLKIIYRPASAGFRGINDSVLTKTFSDLPDVSILTGPLKKLQQVVHAVNDALDPYSRSVAKNAVDKNTLDSLVYLPLALWPDEAQKDLSELKSKVDQGAVTMLFQELLLKLNGNTTTLSKEKTLVLARVLESVSIGMEPDVLGAAKAPKAEDVVVLFAEQSGDELPRTTSAYQAALLTLQLSSAVAMADGEFSATEINYLQEQISLWTHLSVSHQRRLMAHLNLLKSAPVSLAGLKRKFEPLPLSERESIAAFLATVAQSDGEALPVEVDILKKIYKAMGVDPSKVFSDIHAVASGTKPASETTSKEGAGFTLNAERIAQLQRESEKVSILLADIFKEDEPVISNHPSTESAPETAAVDDFQCLLGLDESHTALARMLLSRPQWSREDLLDVAADLDLMLDGALEHINEASFDIYDIAFTDGEDPITINLEIFEKIEP